MGDTPYGHACGVRVQRVQKVQRVQRGRLTGLRPEGCGIARRAMSIKSALRDFLSVSYGKITILLTGSLRSPPPIRLCHWTHLRCEGSEGSKGSKGKVLKMDRPRGRRVLKFDGLSGRGLWIARWAMLIKSALRDLLSVPYGMIRILVISRYAAPPYPATPDFPPFGEQNKSLYAFL